MKFEYPDGATPLDPDATDGLIPNLTLQAELNDFEARNILEAVRWAKRSRGADRDTREADQGSIERLSRFVQT